MKNNVPCALVRDLAPLYAEDLVSDESREELEAHVQECKECRAYYDRVTKDMECEKMEEARQETMEIDYMKKIRRYQRINTVLGAVTSFLLGVFLPVGIVGISVFARKGIPDYYWARLQLVWPLALLRMFVSGVVVCVVYCIINWLIRKKWSK